VEAGHSILISLPKEFERFAKDFKLNYTIQGKDDITGLLNETPDTSGLLEWMKRVIDQQFDEYVPVLKDYDLFIAHNTEFAAPHIAEYCKKPLIRTALGPLLPSRHIFPPMFPVLYPPKFLRPALMWKLLNTGLNLMMLKNLNRRRAALGMTPIKDQGEYAPTHSDNFLIYSPSLGEIDPDWPYKWHAGGYCFSDGLAYDETVVEALVKFIKKDQKPTLFFTFGSCKHKKMNDICEWLYDICRSHSWKLVVGAGWFFTKNGERPDLYVLSGVVPHNLILPYFDAVVHHGGSGTTHSVARAGRPQLILPILLDQSYFARRVDQLHAGPRAPKISRLTRAKLEAKVVDLMENPTYTEGAAALAAKINAEDGVEAFVKYVERFDNGHKK
jgi:UDP:flavonoid glycosyltransferase YjiC (YdhE family)